MKFQTIVIGYVFALALFLFAQRRPTDIAQPSNFRGVVDLTHSASAKMPATNKAAVLSSGNSIPQQDTGTKIEAPAGISRSLWSVDQIPPERLIGSLVVFDVRQEAKQNPDYEVSVADIARWERTYGEIPPGAMVMARTSWDSRWSSSRTYRNSDNKGVMHFPGYSEDAAKFLVEGRNVYGLGIDTLSVDNGPSKNPTVHQYMLAHSVYPLENVANLDRVPANGAVAIVAPTKLAGGSSSPVRILALVK